MLGIFPGHNHSNTQQNCTIYRQGVFARRSRWRKCWSVIIQSWSISYFPGRKIRRSVIYRFVWECITFPFWIVGWEKILIYRWDSFGHICPAKALNLIGWGTNRIWIVFRLIIVFQNRREWILKQKTDLRLLLTFRMLCFRWFFFLCWGLQGTSNLSIFYIKPNIFLTFQVSKQYPQLWLQRYFCTLGVINEFLLRYPSIQISLLLQ